MSGARCRRKGRRIELELVHRLQEAGFAAQRIPLSGSAGGKFRGDIATPLLGRDLVVEVKCRAGGFRELYRWLTDRDLLIVRADRHQPLVVVPFPLALEIARAAEREKTLHERAA